MSIRVMIIDDSAFARKYLSKVLEKVSDVEVHAFARSGKEALEKLGPETDVVTIDYNMPGMNGIETLREIRRQGHTCRIILCSSSSEKGSPITISALDEGAHDFVQKISGDDSRTKKEFENELISKVVTLGKRRHLLLRQAPSDPKKLKQAKLRLDAKLKENVISIVLIGSSTGGPSALMEIIPALPKDFPVPVVISQHMPASSTTRFAQDLHRASQINITEAKEGLALGAGNGVLLPGGKNVKLERLSLGGEFVCRVLPCSEDASIPCPSVNDLFSSVIEDAKDVLAIMLTGIGDDGAKAMLELKKAGAITLAQDEESCVVYGMPRVAAKLGAIDEVIKLMDLGQKIDDYVKMSHRNTAALSGISGGRS
ncbi:MAG: chemotaxis-specific protein-glutamate methyltransferase CheB [Candidatus Lindowbacteria bacterium]|nr:chemotaxis-specific protein-glutamate methyltransferase CheB [Candidatus Lindowbacteria bacterium]